jgi:two-component system chemotaxis response regulator CheY
VLVDPDEESRLQATDILKSVGLSVQHAKDPDHAMSMARDCIGQNQKVMIATDYDKMTKNGIRLIQTCREDPKGLTEIPILGISKNKDDCDPMMLAGSNGFVLKPYKDHKLAERCHALLARSAAKIIVVVDDNLIGRSVSKRMLTAIDFTIVTAENGKLGLETLHRMNQNNQKTGNKLACVCTDYNMPEMDGCELTKELRRDEALHKLPVIIMSLTTESEELFLDAGANAVVRRPIQEKVLQDAVNNVITITAQIEAFDGH